MELLKIWNTGEICFTITTNSGRELSYKIIKGDVYNYIGTPIYSGPFKTSLKSFICSEGMKYLKNEAYKVLDKIAKLENRKKIVKDSLFVGPAMKDINTEMRFCEVKKKWLKESWNILKSMKEAV